MKKEELYKVAIKADKEANKHIKYNCNYCFCALAKRYMKLNTYFEDYLKWKEENNVHTVCGSVLFYLQDLGIIEILSGATRHGSVHCESLDYVIKHSNQGNKI